MFLAWVVFPLVVFVVATGCGLVVRAAVLPEIPGTLLPGIGLAVIVLVGQVTTLGDFSAGLTTPLILLLAVVGWILALPWAGLRPGGWALVAVLAVFAVYAAPIVASGQATFAGFIKLDDTATWMTLTDRIMDHGRSLSGLPPSTYEATLSFNLGQGYPIGAFIPLGVARDVIGQDLAWVVQPYMASLGAMLGLALFELPRALLASARLRALTAFIAAQPALLYGYYLWGGIKEMTGAALVATTACVAAAAIVHVRDSRLVLLLAGLAATVVGVLSGGGGVWLVPPALAVLYATVRGAGPGFALRRSGLFLAVALVLCLPVIASGGFLPPTSSPIDSPTALGNLFSPLRFGQIAGIWPVGDFRSVPSDLGPTNALVALVLLGALGMLGFAFARRRWGPAIYTAGAVASCVAIVSIGSPWVGGKALATASPALLFGAVLAGAALCGNGRRTLGAALIGVLAVGVAWSNALAYRDVNLAPRDQLAELQKIGLQIGADGPALMTEYEPYGVRHFLRNAAPEGASELRRRVVPLVGGGQLPKGEAADTDRFALPGLLIYRSLVLRRSPAMSRPPSPYSLVYRGRYYEAWQRPPGSPSLIDHLGLGTEVDPAARASCSDVRRLADEVGPNGFLATVRRSPVAAVGLLDTDHPAAWAEPGGGSALIPRTAGRLAATLAAPEAGTYGVWLGGSVRPQVDLSVDGKAVASVRHQLNNAGDYVELGDLPLSAGQHEVELDFHGSDLRPGSGGSPDPIGPLVLSADDAARTAVERVPVDRANELCGRRLDWIEALPG